MLSDRWRKSTRSDQGNCVEARLRNGRVEVRDSRDDEDGPVLRITPEDWTAFAGGVKDGEFDL